MNEETKVSKEQMAQFKADVNPGLLKRKHTWDTAPKLVIIEKALPYKYIRRTGGPGHYEYFYQVSSPHGDYRSSLPPRLSLEEEADLLSRKDQDPAAYHKLVESNLGLVYKIAHEFKGSGVPFDDLVQEGSRGLMDAVRKFDTSKGKLAPYAGATIRGMMQVLIYHEKQAKTDPFVQAGKAEKPFGDIGDEEPKPDEPDEGRKFAHKVGKVITIDKVSYGKLGPEEELALKEDRANIQEALDKLDDNEKFVVEKRILDPDPMTLEQVGALLHLTKQRVGQIENIAIKKMRSYLDKYTIKSRQGFVNWLKAWGQNQVTKHVILEKAKVAVKGHYRINKKTGKKYWVGLHYADVTKKEPVESEKKETVLEEPYVPPMTASEIIHEAKVEMADKLHFKDKMTAYVEFVESKGYDYNKLPSDVEQDLTFQFEEQWIAEAQQILSQPSSKLEDIPFFPENMYDAKVKMIEENLRYEDKLMCITGDYLDKRLSYLTSTFHFWLLREDYLKLRYGTDYELPPEVTLSASDLKNAGADDLQFDLNTVFTSKQRVNEFGNLYEFQGIYMSGDLWQQSWADSSNDHGSHQDWLQMAAMRKQSLNKAPQITTGMEINKNYFEEQQQILTEWKVFSTALSSNKYFGKATEDQRFQYFIEQIHPDRAEAILFKELSSNFKIKILPLMEGVGFRVSKIEEVADVVYDSVYKRTQEFLSKMGYKPDDEVVVFRGSDNKFWKHRTTSELKHVTEDHIIPSNEYTTRPLTSWTLDPTVAFSFSGGTGVVLATKVKIKDIFSHFSSGFGCQKESEVVVKNEGMSNDIKVVWMAPDFEDYIVSEDPPPEPPFPGPDGDVLNSVSYLLKQASGSKI